MRVNKINFDSNISFVNLRRANLYQNQGQDSYMHIAFSGGTGADGSKMRKRLGGMHCPCCGIKMLTNHDIKRVLALPSDAPSKDVIPLLKRYENQLHDIEKGVFNIMEALSKKYPKCNLRQLLGIVRPVHLAALKEDEFAIIDRIKNVAAFLSAESQAKLTDTLSEAEGLILNKNYDSTFKRRAFIGKIGDLASEIKEKDAADTIFAIAHEMPRAGNNISAFIVKYSEKNPATGVDRDSHDIIQGLMMPSLGSIEHIRPQSPSINGGGANKMHNYIIECSRDNNMRDCMPFWEFIRQNPQFYGEHVQRYIDAIIDRLNNGELQGFEHYPLQISRTLRRQSKGRIKLDISRLNLPKQKTEYKKLSK